jgi:nitrile hydratase
MGAGSELSLNQLRVRALETILTDKSYIDQDAIGRIVEAHETRSGPRNGALVVARAGTLFPCPGRGNLSET